MHAAPAGSAASARKPALKPGGKAQSDSRAQHGKPRHLQEEKRDRGRSNTTQRPEGTTPLPRLEPELLVGHNDDRPWAAPPLLATAARVAPCDSRANRGEAKTKNQKPQIKINTISVSLHVSDVR